MTLWRHRGSEEPGAPCDGQRLGTQSRCTDSTLLLLCRTRAARAVCPSAWPRLEPLSPTQSLWWNLLQPCTTGSGSCHSERQLSSRFVEPPKYWFRYCVEDEPSDMALSTAGSITEDAGAFTQQNLWHRIGVCLLPCVAAPAWCCTRSPHHRHVLGDPQGM